MGFTGLQRALFIPAGAQGVWVTASRMQGGVVAAVRVTALCRMVVSLQAGQQCDLLPVPSSLTHTLLYEVIRVVMSLCGMATNMLACMILL